MRKIKVTVNKEEIENTTTNPTKIKIENINIFYGDKQVLFDISTDLPQNTVNAIIGPSGCGKSTLIRSINRLHELTKGARVEGKIFLDGHDIYHPEANPVIVRRKIGMVFQKPNPFPNMTIFDNVVAGLKLQGVNDNSVLEEVAVKSLEKVGLLEEVEEDMKSKRGTDLSGGQQQRLCIARTIAIQPEVILMDEPTASLDPLSTLVIEDLMLELKKDYTVIAVTHNMQQAARVSDYTTFLYNGKLIEHGLTRVIFEKPNVELTEQYITGRFG